MSKASKTSESAERIRGFFSRGIEGADRTKLCESLNLPPQAEDRKIAAALVPEVAKSSAESIRVAVIGWQDPREAAEVSRVFTLDASYLGRLTTGGSERRLDLERFDDPRTLLGVLRAGTLDQRRAAARRLGALLEQPGKLPDDELREITDTLSQLRDVEISHDLAAARARLSGVEGRRARAMRREWERPAAEVEREVISFWNGQRSDEPIAAMHSDQRSHLFAHAPDLPEAIISHLGAMIEGADGVSDLATRHALVASLRHAADPRLLPSLRSLLDGDNSDLLVAAIRALGHIDDPRAHPALRYAYDRATTLEERVTAAGALGMVGDRRGLDQVRAALRSGDEDLLGIGLEAMEYLGGPEDCQIVYPALDHQDPILVTAAVKTLGRIGDGRALASLQHLRQRVRRSALRAEIEEAEAAIHARMDLLGEEPPPVKDASQAYDTAKMAALVTRRDPAGVSLRARWSYLVGHLWLLLGAESRAIARFEAAASLRPGWVAPVIAVAMTYARGERYAQALGAFRRALDIDRASIEKNPARVQTLARSFFRRADMVERQGRLDIACGLLDEVLAVDLRKAPSGLRFAIDQRREELRAKQT